jgi:hypothetical protein
LKSKRGKCAAAYLAAFATLAGGLTVGVAATATAADTLRINARPERVVVNQHYENVRWRVFGGRWLRNGVDVELMHVRSRETSDFDYDSDPSNGYRGRMRAYDWERMGAYVVKGVGWDADFNEHQLARDRIMIKRAARVALGGRRHHRKYVNLRAKVRKYHGGYPVWRNHRNARVVFKRKTASGWQRIRIKDTNRRGVAKVRVQRWRPARYRAIVRPTSTVWGRGSASIRR